jgi:hypothetical protein
MSLSPIASEYITVSIHFLQIYNDHRNIQERDSVDNTAAASFSRLETLKLTLPYSELCNHTIAWILDQVSEWKDVDPNLLLLYKLLLPPPPAPLASLDIIRFQDAFTQLGERLSELEGWRPADVESYLPGAALIQNSNERLLGSLGGIMEHQQQHHHHHQQQQWIKGDQHGGEGVHDLHLLVVARLPAAAAAPAPAPALDPISSVILPTYDTIEAGI